MNKPTLPTTRYTTTRKLTPAILYVILISGAVMAVVPFFWMISTSLMTLGETINRQYLPKVPQLINYIEAWEEAKFDGRRLAVHFGPGCLRLCAHPFRGSQRHICLAPGDDDDS